MIAAFINGKIFGFAVFSAESLCSIAINEPLSLSTAIRKMKFLKASINAEYSLTKVLVYTAPSTSKTSTSDVHEIDHKVHIPLFITVIASNGDLLAGPIGTTSSLQIESITNIQELLNASSPIYQMKCIDVALLNSSMKGPSSCSISPEMCTGIALFSGGFLAIIDISTGAIMRSLRLNLLSPSRISLLSANRHSAPVLEWQATLIGIETNNKTMEGTNLFVLLHKSACHDKSVLLQLGACNTSTSCIDSTSPPTDTIFCKQHPSSGGRSSSSTILGRTTSDALWRSISSILRGLNNDVTLPVQPCSDNSETSVTFLTGRILNLKMIAQECEGSLSYEKELNPFDVEELLDRSLETMTSLRSSGEIIGLLKALFVCVYDPPDMFLDRALQAAKVTLLSLCCSSTISSLHAGGGML